MKTIDNMVYGHAQAKKALKVLLKRSQEHYYKKCVKLEDVYPAPLRMLLIGESGTGKTHLIHSMKKLHKFPLITLDATQLTPSGNVDGINAKQLSKLIYKTATEYTSYPEYHSVEGVISQMVIFVDEFDKLGVPFESSGNWNRHVQANFLTLIDSKEEFAGISWIFAGAFSELFKNKVGRQDIGFCQISEKDTIEITDQDIIKAGIIPELLGRISVIVELDRFTEQDYRKVLDKLLFNYPELSDISVDTISKIVEKAVKSGQGIRSMTRQLEMLSIELDDEMEHNYIHPR